EPLPETIDDRAGEAPVVPVRHQIGQLPQPFLLRPRGVDRAQVREQELGLRPDAGRFVTAVDLRRGVGHYRRQSIRVRQFTAVHESVVAGGTLHVYAKDHLRDVLGELDLRYLTGIDHATPLDAFDEPLGLG